MQTNVLVVGGLRSFVKEGTFAENLRGCGITVTEHVEYKTSRPVNNVPAGCDAVIVVNNLISHMLSNSAKAAAKKAGVPFISAPAQWAITEQRLREHGLVRVAAAPTPGSNNMNSSPMTQATPAAAAAPTRYYTCEEAGRQLGLSGPAVHAMRKSGRIQAVRGLRADGKEVWHISEDDLLHELERRSALAATPAAVSTAADGQITSNPLDLSGVHLYQNQYRIRGRGVLPGGRRIERQVTVPVTTPYPTILAIRDRTQAEVDRLVAQGEIWSSGATPATSATPTEKEAVTMMPTQETPTAEPALEVTPEAPAVTSLPDGRCDSNNEAPEAPEAPTAPPARLPPGLHEVALTFARLMFANEVTRLETEATAARGDAELNIQLLATSEAENKELREENRILRERVQRLTRAFTNLRNGLENLEIEG